MNKRLKSFTLAELMIVMVITAIVVGIAFSVLRLVQKQIFAIQKNYEKSTNLSLFEQRLWQDFNQFHDINFESLNKSIVLRSEIDTIVYKFNYKYILRNLDTIKLDLTIDKILYEGKKIDEGNIDAISISAASELHNYTIFISKNNDLTYSMNQQNGI
jgi:type II secretory pathway pseudopilin PulG